MQQGVDLATGEVTVIDRFAPIEPSDPVDLACYLGRFLVLQSNEDNAVVPGDDTGGLCAFGSHPPSSGIPRTTYAELGDVPSDESLCACTDGDCWGANLLCSVNATTGGPACVGFGMLARDRRRQERYRVRVVDDGLQFITFEWLAVAR